MIDTASFGVKNFNEKLEALKFIWFHSPWSIARSSPRMLLRRRFFLLAALKHGSSSFENPSFALREKAKRS